MVGSDGERGFTLIEMMVTVSIIAMMMTVVMFAFAQNPGAIQASVVEVQAAIDEARSVAALNSDGKREGAGTGATIQFTTDPETKETVIKVYWGRHYNIGQRLYPLTPDANIPEIRSKVHIRLAVLGTLMDPPFAIFVSPSAHASSMSGYFGGTLNARYSEHPCMNEMPIEFSIASNVQRRYISCESTQILMEPLTAATAGAQPLRHLTP